MQLATDGNFDGGTNYDPVFRKAKTDVETMLEIIERYGAKMEMHKTRKEMLHKAFEKILV